MWIKILAQPLNMLGHIQIRSKFSTHMTLHDIYKDNYLLAAFHIPVKSNARNRTFSLTFISPCWHGIANQLLDPLLLKKIKNQGLILAR